MRRRCRPKRRCVMLLLLLPEKGSPTRLTRSSLVSSRSSSSAVSRTSLSSRASTRTGQSLSRSTSHGVCSGCSRERYVPVPALSARVSADGFVCAAATQPYPEEGPRRVLFAQGERRQPDQAKLGLDGSRRLLSRVLSPFSFSAPYTLCNAVPDPCFHFVTAR